ncbi:uncharacterized protein LOC116037180 [Sander lucioperca]|uniref:uncharacterized protein LOC116037180 n=1 Tax=Sander lucioperca TaxID=283035 RepID=UPI00165365AA|nr:uncharacterized protein LOC116037180 [Sander lucioperca]
MSLDTGLISIDQEKAFDRVEHQYLWQKLSAFGFSPGFIAQIQVLDRDIVSILKVNGGLAAPFNEQRGVRQGCSLSDSLFLMDVRKLSVQTLPPFYRGVFTVWKLLVKERRLQGDSLHWLLQEPVVYGERLDYPCWAGSAITDAFCRARVLTLGTVVDITGPKLDNAAALAAVLGVRSVRIITKLLDHWKNKLSRHESIMLEQYTGGLTTSQPDDSFPGLCVRPCLDHYGGRFLDVQHCTLEMKEKVFSKVGEVFSKHMFILGFRTQKKPESPEPEPEPEPSCVSLKSNRSHQGLIDFKGEQPSVEKRIHQRPDSAEPEPSCVSFKSDRSHQGLIDFKGQQPSAEKSGLLEENIGTFVKNELKKIQKTNQTLLRGLMTQTGSSSETYQETVEYIKRKFN